MREATFLLAAVLLGTASAQEPTTSEPDWAPTGRLSQFRGFATPRPTGIPENAQMLYASIWAAWSAWSFCSNGVRMRVRACNTVRGFSCLGPNQETRPCDAILPPSGPNAGRQNNDYDVIDPWEQDRREAMKQLYPDDPAPPGDSADGQNFVQLSRPRPTPRESLGLPPYPKSRNPLLSYRNILAKEIEKRLYQDQLLSSSEVVTRKRVIQEGQKTFVKRIFPSIIYKKRKTIPLPSVFKPESSSSEMANHFLHFNPPQIPLAPASSLNSSTAPQLTPETSSTTTTMLFITESLDYTIIPTVTMPTVSSHNGETPQTTVALPEPNSEGPSRNDDVAIQPPKAEPAQGEFLKLGDLIEENSMKNVDGQTASELSAVINPPKKLKPKPDLGIDIPAPRPKVHSGSVPSPSLPISSLPNPLVAKKLQVEPSLSEYLEDEGEYTNKSVKEGEFDWVNSPDYNMDMLADLYSGRYGRVGK